MHHCIIMLILPSSYMILVFSYLGISPVIYSFGSVALFDLHHFHFEAKSGPSQHFGGSSITLNILQRKNWYASLTASWYLTGRGPIFVVVSQFISCWCYSIHFSFQSIIILVCGQQQIPSTYKQGLDSLTLSPIPFIFTYSIKVCLCIQSLM